MTLPCRHCRMPTVQERVSPRLTRCLSCGLYRVDASAPILSIDDAQVRALGEHLASRQK